MSNKVTIEWIPTTPGGVIFYHLHLNGEHVETFSNLSKALALKADLEQPLGCTDDESEV